MNEPIRVLLVEDVEEDAMLLLREMHRGGFAPASTRVQTPEELERALKEREWDVVISDFNLPRLDGSRALTMVKQLTPDLPFILVSGALGEETAVSSIKAGADDYLLKDRLTRLPQAVQRAIELRRERQGERERIQQARDEIEQRVRDRTAQLLDLNGQLLASVNFARSTLDAMTAHIAILDETGCIVDVNRAWRVFADANDGHYSRLFTGSNYLEVCDGASGMCSDGAREAADGIRAVIRGEQQVFSMEYPCHGPTQRRWAMLRVTRFAGGGPVRVVVAHEDITEARLAQETLQQQATELERARAAADAANRAKSDFLAAMSHEIRTPLNGVVGMIDLVSSTPLTPMQQRHLTLARASAQTLLVVINDILDFSKIEAGKLALEHTAFDLEETVEDVIAMLAPGTQQNGVELACSMERIPVGLVRGDSARLRQILINLIGNAIKFTERGAITVHLAPDGGTAQKPRIRFTITDTGIGISPAKLGLLFQPFTQADTTMARRYGGTGLGLTISKRLAELMGGSIGAESTDGKGSTFWFTAEFECVEAAAGAPVRDLHNRRMLVVSGSTVRQSMLSDLLASWNARCECCSTADSAIAHLRAAHSAGDPYTAIIVDGASLATDPLHFPEAVREFTSASGTVLLLLHPVSVPLDEARVRAAGFAEVVAKPICRAHLFDSLAHGTTRTITAPACDAQHARATALSPVAEPPGQPSAVHGVRLAGRVLVAEDNAINQVLVRELLNRAGLECRVVQDGRQAVNAVCSQGEHFDLVLMDCQMPTMDGFEATREIRRLEVKLHRHTPIIALTANAMQGDRDACLSAGMDAYVPKPISPGDLLRTIEQLLPRSAAPAQAH